MFSKESIDEKLPIQDADITLPEHFDHVTPSFLSSIGLSEPAQRRLLAAVKKEKKRNKKHLKQVQEASLILLKNLIFSMERIYQH